MVISIEFMNNISLQQRQNKLSLALLFKIVVRAVKGTIAIEPQGDPM